LTGCLYPIRFALINTFQAEAVQIMREGRLTKRYKPFGIRQGIDMRLGGEKISPVLHFFAHLQTFPLIPVGDMGNSVSP